jgi:hypothetical protein
LPHLVTPGQGIDFYEEAFRELQVLERDLLERGGWPEARARVTYLGDRASSLAAALGPPARSGDDDFRAALNKVDFVLSYIERIQPLLETVDVKDVEDGEILEDVPFADEDRGVMNKLGRLFKGD